MENFGTPPQHCCGTEGPGRRCSHLDPAVLAVLWHRAHSQRALCLLGQHAHSRHELLVAIHTGEKRENWDLGAGLAAGRVGAASTHLQTKTSSGAAVLGVMIQGATRKTTESVKIGDSRRPWGGGDGVWDLSPLSHPPGMAGMEFGICPHYPSPPSGMVGTEFGIYLHYFNPPPGFQRWSLGSVPTVPAPSGREKLRENGGSVIVGMEFGICLHCPSPPGITEMAFGICPHCSNPLGLCRWSLGSVPPSHSPCPPAGPSRGSRAG